MAPVRKCKQCTEIITKQSYFKHGVFFSLVCMFCLSNLICLNNKYRVAMAVSLAISSFDSHKNINLITSIIFVGFVYVVCCFFFNRFNFNWLTTFNDNSMYFIFCFCCVYVVVDWVSLFHIVIPDRLMTQELKPITINMIRFFRCVCVCLTTFSINTDEWVDQSMHY